MYGIWKIFERTTFNSINKIIYFRTGLIWYKIGKPLLEKKIAEKPHRYSYKCTDATNENVMFLLKICKSVPFISLYGDLSNIQISIECTRPSISYNDTYKREHIHLFKFIHNRHTQHIQFYSSPNNLHNRIITTISNNNNNVWWTLRQRNIRSRHCACWWKKEEKYFETTIDMNESEGVVKQMCVQNLGPAKEF